MVSIPPNVFLLIISWTWAAVTVLVAPLPRCIIMSSTHPVHLPHRRRRCPPPSTVRTLTLPHLSCPRFVLSLSTLKVMFPFRSTSQSRRTYPSIYLYYVSDSNPSPMSPVVSINLQLLYERVVTVFNQQRIRPMCHPRTFV